MVTRSAGGATMTVLEEQPVQEETKLVPLQLRPYKNVQWTEDTIDNEHMNKRKSKSKCQNTKLIRHPLQCQPRGPPTRYSNFLAYF